MERTVWPPPARRRRPGGPPRVSDLPWYGASSRDTGDLPNLLWRSVRNFIVLAALAPPCRTGSGVTAYRYRRRWCRSGGVPALPVFTCTVACPLCGTGIFRRFRARFNASHLPQMPCVRFSRTILPPRTLFFMLVAPPPARRLWVGLARRSAGESQPADQFPDGMRVVIHAGPPFDVLCDRRCTPHVDAWTERPRTRIQVLAQTFQLFLVKIACGPPRVWCHVCGGSRHVRS